MGSYAEFVCRAGGSNMNGGRLNSNLEPATTPVYSATNGAWNSSTGVFTPVSGNPSLTVTVGDYAHVFTDGATTPAKIARVTAVTSTTITLSGSATTGTGPSTAGSGISINVGGAWLGPNGTDQFPFNGSAGINGAMTAVNGDRPRVNMKNDQTYSMTSGISWNASSVTKVQGYTSTFGDGGRATFDGGTSGSAYTLFTNSGANAVFEDLIFQNNGATGTAPLVSSVTSGAAFFYFRRVTFKNSRGDGYLLNGGASGQKFVECEAYNNNLSNTANQGGFSVPNGFAFFYRCYSHSNPGSNSAGFVFGSQTACYECIADSNGGAGFSTGADNAIMRNCDAYNNGSHGIVFTASGGSGQALVENCNLFKNGGWGIQFSGGGGGNLMAYFANCAFGSGTMANASGTWNQSNSGAADIFESVGGHITLPSNTHPWKDPDNGDFSIVNPLVQGKGRGIFLQTQNNKAGTVSYPDIGAGIHQEGANMASKFRTSIWSSQTLTAGAGNTTSSSVDLSMGYGANVDITLTNGATGPTIAAQVQIQIANDAAGTLWTNLGGPLVGDTANNAVSNFSVAIPPQAAAVRLVAGSNTAQNVTVNADISNLIAI